MDLIKDKWTLKAVLDDAVAAKNAVMSALAHIEAKKLEEELERDTAFLDRNAVNNAWHPATSKSAELQTGLHIFLNYFLFLEALIKSLTASCDNHHRYLTSVTSEANEVEPLTLEGVGLRS